MQAAADVRGVVADAKGAPDNFRHPLARPDLPAEAVGLRPALQQCGQVVPLLGAQARLTTGSGMTPQPVQSLLAAPFELLADCPRRHAEGSGVIPLFPALLLQLPGAPPPFAPVEPGFLCAHGGSRSSL